MAKALVTGGTGFIGAHVVRALLSRGDHVRCLLRPSSRQENLRGLDVELVEGDLLDPSSLRPAIAGVDVVHHLAADYRLFAPSPAELWRVNVEGTDNLFEAAFAADVKRVVYTSSVGALGLRQDRSPADETTPVQRSSLVGHYKKSKYDAERVADAWVRRGLPVVIVNPSTPVGELDRKPTPTGKIVVDFLTGRMPAYVDTGLNLIDVRDVALGHLLAEKKGRIGERYILGNENLSLRSFLELLAEIAGRPAPKLRLPHWIPLTFAALDTVRARFLGGEPKVPFEAARLATSRMFFDPSKARAELGLPRGPLRPALERAVEWFRSEGYVKPC
jgi:dihydroflavonol-4-reductase